MKMNRYISIVLAALLLPGCMKDKTLETRTAAGESVEMVFGVGEAKTGTTRGFDTVLADLDEVGLYGYYTATERWAWSAANTSSRLKPNYFTNTPLWKDGDAAPYSWRYDGLPRFWPPDTRNKVSFFAYAPYVATVDADGNPIDLTGELIVPYPAVPTETGLPVLNYTLPATIKEHIDILRAATIDMTRLGADEDPAATGDDGIVALQMRHALTRITYSAMYAGADKPGFVKPDYDVKVNSAIISGIYGKGTLRLDTGEWVFDPADGKISVSAMSGVDLADKYVGETGDPTPLMNNKINLDPKDDVGALMLMPQSLDEAYLTVSLTFIDNNKTSTTVPISFSLKDTGIAWEPGRHIDYCIQIKGGFITVHTSIELWISYGNNGSANVGL